MTPLAENRYGKSRVRLARVKRTPERHEFQEWTVQTSNYAAEFGTAGGGLSDTAASRASRSTVVAIAAASG